MSLFEHAKQLAKAIHDTLSGDLDVQSVLGPVPRLYDFAPEDPVYPYVSYGSMRSDDISGDECALFEHTLSIHIWSRYAGRAEVLACIAAIAQALNENKLSLTSGHCISARVVFTDHFRGTDGRTLHGIVRLIVVTQN